MLVTRATYGLIQASAGLNTQAIVAVLTEHGVPCELHGDTVIASAMIAGSDDTVTFVAGVMVAELGKWLGY